MLLVAVAFPARADLAVSQPAKDEWGAPEIALRRNAHGKDEALVVVYTSGRVLYRDRQGGQQPFDYLMVTLTPAEKRALIDGLPLEARDDWGSGGTDCWSYFLDSWSSGPHRRDYACGWPDDKKTPQIWDRLATFSSRHAKRWVPPLVTVTVDIYPTSGGAPGTVDWPRGWPTSDTPIHRFGRDGWTFTLDGSSLPELRRVNAQCASNRWGTLPLVSEGRYLWFSFDYALPHEEAWKRK